MCHKFQAAEDGPGSMGETGSVSAIPGRAQESELLLIFLLLQIALCLALKNSSPGFSTDLQYADLQGRTL